jgi:hypothetical protein
VSDKNSPKNVRQTALNPLQAVANGPEGDPLLLDEINDIVHEVRRKHRQSQPSINLTRNDKS